MRFQKPQALQKGDTIGIVALSRWIEPARLKTASDLIEAHGYKVKIHPNNGLRLHEWAGNEKERARAFEDYWCDPEIKCIITAAGGTRTLHMLDHINFEKIEGHQKLLCGFSDITALHNALLTQAHCIGLHGPDAGRFAKPNAQTFFESFEAIASGSEDALEAYVWDDANILHYGEGTGTLIGGNLCIFSYLLGTQYAPDFKGALLILEEAGEEIRNIDRMLLQLGRLGKLEELSGIIIGDFTEVQNTGAISYPYSVEDLVHEHFDGLGIPVIMNAPFGHGGRLQTLPLGCKARLKAGKSNVQFQLLEPAVNLS